MIAKLRTRLTTPGVSLSLPLLPLAFQNIHPYIDPGTGSLIIQIVIGSLIGGFFLLKVFWGKVIAFFGRLFSRANKGDR